MHNAEFTMPILEYVIEGTVSQLFDLGSSFYFMKILIEKIRIEKITKSFPFCEIK